MSEKIANKSPSKRRGNPNWVKGGASPYPKGRPKDGESWASIIKSVGDMYPSDLLAFIGKDNDLGRVIAQLPENVQMKYLVTARVFAALMFEPSAGLWSGLMERVEGKVTTPIDVTSKGEQIGQADDARASIQRKLAEIAGTASGSSVHEPTE